MTLLVVVALLPLAALAVWWAAKNPFRGLVVYAAILPLGSSIDLPLGLPDPFNTVSTLLGAAAGASLLIRLLADPSFRAPVPAVTWVWLMFLAVNALTYLWSINRDETISQLLILAPLVALFAVASMYRASPRDLNALEAALIAGGALAGIVALAMAATGNLHPSGTGVDRFYSSGGDPNITAASLLLPFGVAMSWAVGGRDWQRRLGFPGAILIALAVLLTVSRGGVLSLLAVVAVWLIFTRRLRLLWVTAIIAVLAFAFLPDDVTDRLTQPGSTGRTAIWEVGATACPEHCLTGAGMGVFPRVHEETILDDPTTTGIQLRLESHNILLGAAMELGLAGLTLLVAGLTLTMLDLRHAIGHRQRAALSGLVGVLAANMLISNLEFKYFWLALTYCTLVSALGRRTEGPPVGPQTSPNLRGSAM